MYGHPSIGTAICGVWFTSALVLCSASFGFAADDLPASAPIVQETPTTPADETAIQERAIRQGAGAEQGAQCVCEHALGQCVFNAFGCVPHQGNPCNGGCVMKQPNSSIGGAAPSRGLTIPPGRISPGATTR
jgi:hypothetical protein